MLMHLGNTTKCDHRHHVPTSLRFHHHIPHSTSPRLFIPIPEIQYPRPPMRTSHTTRCDHRHHLLTLLRFDCHIPYPTSPRYSTRGHLCIRATPRNVSTLRSSITLFRLPRPSFNFRCTFP